MSVKELILIVLGVILAAFAIAYVDGMWTDAAAQKMCGTDRISTVEPCGGVDNRHG